MSVSIGAFKQQIIRVVNNALKECTGLGLKSCSVLVQENLIVLIGDKKAMPMTDKIRREYSSDSLQTLGLVREVLRKEVKKAVEKEIPIHIKSVFKDFDYDNGLSLVVIVTEEQDIPAYLSQLSEP